VPLQEYVYEPVPPEGTALQVVDWPACSEEGDAEQVTPNSGCVTVTLADAEADAELPAHETRYEAF